MPSVTEALSRWLADSSRFVEQQSRKHDHHRATGATVGHPASCQQMIEVEASHTGMFAIRLLVVNGGNVALCRGSSDR
jgi:hypothetical protein